MQDHLTFEPFTGKAGATVYNQDSELISSCTGISKSFNFSSSNIAICILSLTNRVEFKEVLVSIAVPNNFGS